MPPSYMTGLYPIIRRVRRPLIVQDAPPVNAGNAEPVAAEAKTTDNGPQTTDHEKTPSIEEPGPTVGS